jgi:8-amino-7-oxononanoate synthase
MRPLTAQRHPIRVAPLPEIDSDMSSTGPLSHLADALSDLERRGLRRTVPRPLEGTTPSFCSNDYLGLADRATGRTRAGAGASRLIAGERHEHAELERAVARWLGTEAALAFTSGYAANVGTLSALAGPADLIVSDALNHASLVDGARLSRAKVAITPHNDVDAIASALAQRSEQRAWVVVESYYSMDADGPDLRRLRAVCDEHGAALYVDEAHALGVLGPAGRGRAAEAAIAPDILVGTLGKAFGSQGAFVAGSRDLREWLWNRARSFVYSTGLSPAAAEAGRLALEESLQRPELRAHALALATRLRSGLAELGLRVLGFGHVVPVLVGSNADAVLFTTALAERGVVVPPIRPPTVPENTARLRLAVTAAHTERDIDFVIEAFRATGSRP